MKLMNFFEDYLKQKSANIDLKKLNSVDIPKNLLQRQKQMQELLGIITPILKRKEIPNVMVYGRPKAGKTLLLRYISGILNVFVEKNKLKVKIIYVDCKTKGLADTEYRLLIKWVKELGYKGNFNHMPCNELYNIFIDYMNKNRLFTLIILDDLDNLVTRRVDEILFNLGHINNKDLKKSRISLIGISNNLLLSDKLDPRIASFLHEKEVVFPIIVSEVKMIKKKQEGNESELKQFLVSLVGKPTKKALNGALTDVMELISQLKKERELLSVENNELKSVLSEINQDLDEIIKSNNLKNKAVAEKIRKKIIVSRL